MPAPAEGGPRPAEGGPRPAGDGPLSDPGFVAGLRPVPTTTASVPATWTAADITGVRPSGEGVRIELGGSDRPVLVVFLATRCDGCEAFWRGLREPAGVGLPASLSIVAVTKGPESVPPAEVERAAAGIDRVPVVMSDQAWTDYRVSGYPFFVLADQASRAVIAETVGFGWPDVIAMIGMAGR